MEEAVKEEDDLVTALCRALSLYAWEHGERFGSRKGPEYRTMDFPVGDKDRFSPYIVSLSNGELHFTVSAPEGRKTKRHG